MHLLNFNLIDCLINTLTLPIAINPPSKSIMTPIAMKNKPNAVSPTPISTTQDKINIHARFSTSVSCADLTLTIAQPHFLVLRVQDEEKKERMKSAESPKENQVIDVQITSHLGGWCPAHRLPKGRTN